MVLSTEDGSKIQAEIFLPSGDFGWAGSGIWARGRVWRRPKKVNLGRKWIEMEDEGKSSRGKVRTVLAVLLVVAVCQNTPSEIQIHAKVP